MHDHSHCFKLKCKRHSASTFIFATARRSPFFPDTSAKFGLPPTPAEQPPSPLTFRSPRRLSLFFLFNSPSSPPSDNSSCLVFQLPLIPPSSEDSESSQGMHFVPAHNGQGKEKNVLHHGLFSSLKKACNATRSVASLIAFQIIYAGSGASVEQC